MVSGSILLNNARRQSAEMSVDVDLLLAAQNAVDISRHFRQSFLSIWLNLLNKKLVSAVGLSVHKRDVRRVIKIKYTLLYIYVPTGRHRANSCELSGELRLISLNRGDK